MSMHAVCLALIAVLGFLIDASAADKAHDVDYYIQQSARRCGEMQVTIDDVGRFMSEYRKRARIDVERWGAEVLEELHRVSCRFRDLLEGENKCLYLYKHVQAEHREAVSRYLSEELISKIEGASQADLREAKASLAAYTGGDVDVNVLHMSERMVGQIAGAGKVIVGIYKFYLSEAANAGGR